MSKPAKSRSTKATKPSKLIRNDLLAQAEAIKPTLRGWFAGMPEDAAKLLSDAKEKIKSGNSTASVRGLYKATKERYPKHIQCSLSAFRNWFSQ